jgi:hypothetical protein
MVRRMSIRMLVAAVAGVLAAPVASVELGAQAQAQAGAQSLGSVRVSRQVVANGQALAAGTYTLRVLPDAVPGAVGQTPAESRWVEFVQGGQVKGKELATVVTGEEAKAVVGDTPPSSGGVKAQVLKGNDYLRVWARRGATHYLVHLAIK